MLAVYKNCEHFNNISDLRFIDFRFYSMLAVYKNCEHFLFSELFALFFATIFEISSPFGGDRGGVGA
jgi:hypothetical protein